MIIAREWTEDFMRPRGWNKEMTKETSNIIHDDEYQTNLTIANDIFGLLVKVHRMLDSDEKIEMGYFYESMDHAKEYKETFEGQ